jgi:hypothetical protein
MDTTTSGIPVPVYNVAGADPSNSFKFTAVPSGSDGQAANGNSGPVYAVSAVYSNSLAVPLITVGGSFAITYEVDNYPTTSYKQNAHNIAYTTNNFNPYFWNIMSSPIPQLNGQVKTVAYNGNDIYVGGEFTNVFTTEVNRLARWNTSDQLWYPILSTLLSSVSDNNGLNDMVNKLLLDAPNNRLYIGGKFSSTANGLQSLNFIAYYHLTAKTFTPFTYGSDIGFNDQVLDLSLWGAGSTLYISGNFNSTNNGSLILGRVAAANVTTGVISSINNNSGVSGMNGPVYAILYDVPNEYIYFGGNFSSSFPVPSISLKYASYYDTTPNSIPVILAYTNFFDTQVGLTFPQIILPEQFKLVNLIWDSGTSQWLEAFRSIGVTH